MGLTETRKKGTESGYRLTEERRGRLNNKQKQG